jgi:AraC family transcriptional regulator of adaptative response/methylated-DNA-[protein]-cysteine methyltransferase
VRCRYCRDVIEIKRITDYIEGHLEGDVSLERLSREAGVSRFHLQRSFKAAVGVTPKQYAEACRLRSLKRNLREGADVLGSVFAAGFGSSSRVYERVDTRLGMTPSEYRNRGASTEITHATVETSLGLLTIGATDRGLCFVQFGETAKELEEELRREYPAAAITAMREPRPEPFREWIAALEEHLRGSRARLDLPLDLRATAFQMKVWRYLQSIPYGETRSYAQVAAGIGAPKAARAVARACASNRVALAIPCHRVIRGTGKGSGYRWGVERKRALLEAEGRGRPPRQSTAALVGLVHSGEGALTGAES